jgi:hypothetical protein
LLYDKQSVCCTEDTIDKNLEENMIDIEYKKEDIIRYYIWHNYQKDKKFAPIFIFVFIYLLYDFVNSLVYPPPSFNLIYVMAILTVFFGLIIIRINRLYKKEFSNISYKIALEDGVKIYDNQREIKMPRESINGIYVLKKSIYIQYEKNLKYFIIPARCINQDQRNKIMEILEYSRSYGGIDFKDFKNDRKKFEKHIKKQF